MKCHFLFSVTIKRLPKPSQSLKIKNRNCNHHSKNDFHGNISIEDNSLSYDNDFYLSISKPEKANVIAIGNSDKTNS